VEAVGKFDDHDANIVDHGQNHLANIFGLARFGGQHVETANFGYAFDEPGSFFAKTFPNARNGKFSVFNDVMEKSGGKRGGVHAHVGENVRDFQEMCEIGIAGTADLIAMRANPLENIDARRTSQGSSEGRFFLSFSRSSSRRVSSTARCDRD
jgi:hypothetical protein